MDNNTWYNWYSDGWLEQGGFNNSVSYTGSGDLTCTIPLPKQYSSSSVRTGQVDSIFSYGGAWNGPRANVTTDSLIVSGWSSSGGCTLRPNCWVTWGYSNPPTAADWAENLNTSTYKRYIKY